MPLPPLSASRQPPVRPLGGPRPSAPSAGRAPGPRGRLPALALGLAGLLLLRGAPALRADLAVSANDGKLVQVDGVNTVVHPTPPDTLTVIDLSVYPPRILAEVPDVPCSVIGPPLSATLTPDEHYALVTAAMKVDPADPSRQAPDDRMSVVDLTARPPRVVSTVRTGLSPSGVSVNRRGTLALVANRGDGTVSVFKIHNGALTPAGTVAVGNAASALGHVQFTPDGRRALVTRDGDNKVSILSVDGDRVRTGGGRDITPGFRPYGLDITPDGRFAVTGNVGFGDGDTDTASLIALGDGPAHAVDSVSVGLGPEGIRLSPDGRLCAVVVQNGSNKPRSWPFHSEHGRLVLLGLRDGRLVRLAEAAIGHWSQGAAFSADGRTILVGNMNERNVQVFRWDGRTLTESAPLAVGGGSAALGTVEYP